MKVLLVTDKVGTAIDRLAWRVAENLPHIETRVMAVHPKRPDMAQINAYLDGAAWADVIDFEYFRTAQFLLDNYPAETRGKPLMLAHYNPYSVDMADWHEFNLVTTPNKTIQKKLPHSTLIPIMIDVQAFAFKPELVSNQTVQMVSGRIEAKKGVLPVAQACAQLGYKLKLIGAVSDGEYMQQVMATGCVEFHENASEDDLIQSYYDATIHVCNSIDNFESGTMPVLEAMSCGTPVISRLVGHVPDFYDEQNIMLNEADPEDVDSLTRLLEYVVTNDDVRQELKEKGWQSVKGYDDRRRAVMYERAWHWLLGKGQPLVSVIIPTFNRQEQLMEVLAAFEQQTWQPLEIIVADDASTDDTQAMVYELAKKMARPVKYVSTDTPDGYNLAHARNLGVLNAAGEILVFCDDRYAPDSDAVTQFLAKLQPKTWVFGDKGAAKREFIENFSAIRKDDFVKAGMFNTTVPLYGFQSQELRKRFILQDFKLLFVPEAKAETLIKTKNKYRKRVDILNAKTSLWKLGLQ